MNNPFRKGDRVTTSEAWRAMVRRSGSSRRGSPAVRHGVVHSEPRQDNLVWVKWDGLRCGQSYHIDFIQHEQMHPVWDR